MGATLQNARLAVPASTVGGGFNKEGMMEASPEGIVAAAVSRGIDISDAQQLTEFTKAFTSSQSPAQSPPEL